LKEPDLLHQVGIEAPPLPPALLEAPQTGLAHHDEQPQVPDRQEVVEDRPEGPVNGNRAGLHVHGGDRRTVADLQELSGFLEIELRPDSVALDEHGNAQLV